MKNHNGGKEMRKIVKNILLAVIIIIIAFVYAHVDKNYYLYDRDQDSSKYVNTGILEKDEISQEFVANENTLNGVKVKCLINGNVENVTVQYQLTDKETKKVLVTDEVKANSLKSGKFYKFAFPSMEGVKGKKLIFSLKQIGARESNGVSFYIGSPVKVQEQNSLLISRNETEGILVSRIISHRFDVETFVVFLAFIVYIMIFMKALYKLFK